MLPIEDIAKQLTDYKNRLEHLERLEQAGLSVTFTVNYNKGYADSGGLRIQWTEDSITPAWNNAGDHAWSGPHNIDLPVAFKDAVYQVVAAVSDGRVGARASWLTFISIVDADTIQVYVACADNTEADVTAMIIRISAFGGTP